jgi:hypothetical protein
MASGARKNPCMVKVQRLGLMFATPSLAVLTMSASPPKSGAVGSRLTPSRNGFTRRFLVTPADGNTSGTRLSASEGWAA